MHGEVGGVVDAGKGDVGLRRAFCVSASSSVAPNTAATRASVSARRLTRSTLVAKAGSAASALSPSTCSASTRHSRSLWIEIEMSAPSLVLNTP